MDATIQVSKQTRTACFAGHGQNQRGARKRDFLPGNTEEVLPTETICESPVHDTACRNLLDSVLGSDQSLTARNFS